MPDQNANLGPQFFDHAALGDLKASDYAGHVREGVEPMERWQQQFGGSGNAIHYDEGDSPTAHVSRLREDIRTNGVQKPITVVDWGTHRSIKDGHHRAVAAHLEGQGAPGEVLTSDQYVKRMYG
jgi:hypothetical protein